jgi:hypothetical protein
VNPTRSHGRITGMKRLAILLASLALLVAGCGSGDSGDSGGGGSGRTQTEQQDDGGYGY